MSIIAHHKHPVKLHYLDNDLIPTRDVLLMSDLHSESHEVIDNLIELHLLENSIVFTLGDMAGNGKMGDDGDPIDVYRRLLQNSYRFYFVQGNHDLFNPEVYELFNSDGTRCSLNGTIINIDGIKIAGIDGIIGKENHSKHIYTKDDYFKKMKKLNDIDILMTHDIPIIRKEPTDFAVIPHDMINNKYHIFGHHQYGKIKNVDDGKVFYSLDRRVIMMYSLQ